MPRVSFFFFFSRDSPNEFEKFQEREREGNAFLLNGGNGGMELRRDEKQEL